MIRFRIELNSIDTLINSMIYCYGLAFKTHEDCIEIVYLMDRTKLTVNRLTGWVSIED